MRRTHHTRKEALPRAFRGEDKKKSASGGTPIVIIAALLGAIYYATRTHPTQHAAARALFLVLAAERARDCFSSLMMGAAHFCLSLV